MSARKNITVSRTYRPESHECARALELLLKTTTSRKGGVRAAPDDAVKELNGYDAHKHHNR
jgi:hypothetical protein